MNRNIAIAFFPIFLAGTLFFFTEEGNSQTKKNSLQTQKDKVSYSIGWDIGSNMKKQGLDINIDALSQAMKAALSGGKSQLTEEEMKEVMMSFQKDMQAKQMEQRAKSGDKNQKEGETFLAANKTKPGVKVTPSGLQYKVIKEGKGDKPKATDTVTVDYEGKLISGKVFDSSYQRGEPATFPLNGVIPGWTEGLQLMKIGSTYEFYIPSKLGYGDRGAGGDIEPNSTLIFKVELHSIDKKAK